MTNPQPLHINPIAIALPFIRELQEKFPGWMHDYDNQPDHESSSSELIALLTTAPTPFAAGVIYGKIMARQAAWAANRSSSVAMHPIPSNDMDTGIGIITREEVSLAA